MSNRRTLFLPICAGLLLGGCSRHDAPQNSAIKPITTIKPAPTPRLAKKNEVVAGSGYTVVAPDGWAIKTDVPNADLAFAAPNRQQFASNLVILGAPAPPKITLQDVQKFIESSNAKGLKSFKVAARGKAQIGGEAAVWTDASYLDPGGQERLHFYQAVTQHGAQLWTFSCTAPEADYARDAPKIKAAIGSVKWTK